MEIGDAVAYFGIGMSLAAYSLVVGRMGVMIASQRFYNKEDEAVKKGYWDTISNYSAKKESKDPEYVEKLKGRVVHVLKEAERRSKQRTKSGGWLVNPSDEKLLRKKWKLARKSVEEVDTGNCLAPLRLTIPYMIIFEDKSLDEIAESFKTGASL